MTVSVLFMRCSALIYTEIPESARERPKCECLWQCSCVLCYFARFVVVVNVVVVVVATDSVQLHARNSETVVLGCAKVHRISSALFGNCINSHVCIDAHFIRRGGCLFRSLPFRALDVMN